MLVSMGKCEVMWCSFTEEPMDEDEGDPLDDADISAADRSRKM